MNKIWKIVMVIIVILFPLCIEGLIINNDIPSAFTNNEWFSFWGSYSGVLITCLVLFITLRQNSKQIRAGLKETEIRATSKEKIEVADYAYKIISLIDYYPCDVMDVKFNLYNYLVNDFRTLEFKIGTYKGIEYYSIITNLMAVYIEKLKVLNKESVRITLMENYEVLKSMYEEFEVNRDKLEKSYYDYKNVVVELMRKDIMNNYTV